MENVSTVVTSFVSLGILEMETHWITYSIVTLVLYVITTFLCFTIVIVICVEESLHEPMYIFICNLLLNGVFGNTTIFPHVFVSLVLGTSTISFTACLMQSFFVHSFTVVEMFTFSTMAYDRYLAVGNPLRYSSLMTNTKAFNTILIIWALTFLIILGPVILTVNLRFCGVNFTNVFCETMSLVRLACGNTTFNNIFGLVEALLCIGLSILIVVYCYIRTLVICLKTSKSTSLKAINTLISHIITFSIFLIIVLFVLLRYRINGGSISVTAHSIVSLAGLVTSVSVNPIVYGIRTEAIKLKLIHNLQKLCKRPSEIN